MNEVVSRGELDLDLFIVTAHGSSLEFVLDHAGDRMGCSYYEHLMDMFRKADVNCMGYGAYGDVHYTLRAVDISQMEKEVAASIKVVREWISRYNVNKMKGPP